jgi:hypothetical protein
LVRIHGAGRGRLGLVDRRRREIDGPTKQFAPAHDSDHAVARFLQTTYEAAAEVGRWDRAALEDDDHRLRPQSAQQT